MTNQLPVQTSSEVKFPVVVRPVSDRAREIMNRTPEQIAALFGVPVENIREQFAKNARTSRIMAAKAATSATGKCNGYTEAQLVSAAEMQEAKSATPLTMHITRSAYGKVPVVTIHTLNQASALYRAFLREQNFGSRDAGICQLKLNGKTVARVSFNGRVWAGAEIDLDAGPIYQP